MSKRKSEDQLIKSYKAKIKKLENKKQQDERRRRRVIVYSDSSDFETDKEIETPHMDQTPDDNLNMECTVNNDQLQTTSTSDDILPDTINPILPDDNSTSVLDPEIKLALGDQGEDVPTYGDNILSDIAHRWLPILRKGLAKEAREKLLKEHNIPDNCRLLKAPSLNPEIAAAVAEVVRARDKKIETKQGQLGLGITAISRGISLLISDGNKIDVIKLLSEGCRILTDLHYLETQARTKLITPCLDKVFYNIIQDEQRDETLFGNKLSEKIKAAKTIEKQSLQIKRSIPVSTKPTPQQATTKFRQPGNWSTPPRYPSSAKRGGRGGMYTSNRQAPSTSYRKPQAPPPPPVPPQTRESTRQQRAATRH